VVNPAWYVWLGLRLWRDADAAPELRAAPV